MSVTISGLDEVLAMLDAVQEVVAAPFDAPGVAELAGEYALVLEEALREAAPKREEPGRPNSVYTEPGQFAETIEAYARSSGASVTLEASAMDPVMTWILGGVHHPDGIYPVFAKALRFPWGGEIVFRRFVHRGDDRPMTEPNPFEVEPGDTVAEEMLAAYADAIEAEIARAAAA